VGTFDDGCAYMKNLFSSVENHRLDKLKKFGVIVEFIFRNINFKKELKSL
jgi:hypothetical protein